MELADNMDESAEDMTAADIAPSPIKETAGGVRYCKAIGRIKLGLGSSPAYLVLLSVAFQSVKAFIMTGLQILNLSHLSIKSSNAESNDCIRQ